MFSLSVQFSINLLTDLNNTDKILEEFDSVMAPCMDSNNLFQLLDATSLLWRLNVSYKQVIRNCIMIYCQKIMGIDPGEERWKLVTDAFQSRVGHPTYSWLVSYFNCNKISYLIV